MLALKTIPNQGNACDCLCYKSFIIPWGRPHNILIGYAIAVFMVIRTLIRVLRPAKDQRHEQHSSRSDDVNEHQIDKTDI